MKIDKTARNVIAGYDTVTFSEEDVKAAMFTSAYGREPTAGELKRVLIRQNAGTKGMWMQMTFCEKTILDQE